MSKLKGCLMLQAVYDLYALENSFSKTEDDFSLPTQLSKISARENLLFKLELAVTSVHVVTLCFYLFFKVEICGDIRMKHIQLNA